MKLQVSTSLDEGVVQRIGHLAFVDISSPAAIVRKAIMRGLVDVEREILGRVPSPAAAAPVPAVVCGCDRPGCPGGLGDGIREMGDGDGQEVKR